MDSATSDVLKSFGIDSDKVPSGTVKLLDQSEYRHLSKDAFLWASRSYNSRALAYQVETEEDSHAGFVLRNLYKNKPEASHLFVKKNEEDKGPFFHNLSCALPQIWASGVCLLCEGSKDARYLAQHSLPAVAYLGAVPSRRHLNVIVKFGTSVLWLADADYPLLDVVKRRRERVMQEAVEEGLFIRKFQLKVKDPAELKNDPRELERVKETYKEMCRLV